LAPFSGRLKGYVDNIFKGSSFLDNISFSITYNVWLSVIPPISIRSGNYNESTITFNYSGREGIKKWLDDISKMLAGEKLWRDQDKPYLDAVMFLGLGMREIVKSFLDILGMDYTIPVPSTTGTVGGIIATKALRSRLAEIIKY